MPSEHVDLKIENGLVLTQNGQGDKYDRGAVAIRDGRIVDVGPMADLAGHEAKETLDAGGGLILPGLINCHTHAAMTLFRGLADDMPLLTWLQEHIFPAEAKLNADLVAVGARLACAEMIRGGVTTLCDMYLWEDAVARELDRAGLRAVVGEVLYDFPSPNYGPLESGFDFTRDLIAEYKDHPRISVMVMPHAVYTCSPELLEQAFDLAARTGAGVHTHLAESAGETAQCQELYRRRPVAHYDALGLLRENLLAAHAVDLEDAEITRLAETGVSLALCPESNMKLASGLARLSDLLKAGVVCGLGTDGAASNNDLNMLGEMHSCALAQKAAEMDPTAADAVTVLGLATRRAALALGLADQVGGLEPGKRADIIVVDTSGPHLQPLYNPESHLVYAALPSDVRHTVVEGRVLMADRELTTIDLEELFAAVGRAAERIKG